MNNHRPCGVKPVCRSLVRGGLVGHRCQESARNVLMPELDATRRIHIPNLKEPGKLEFPN